MESLPVTPEKIEWVYQVMKNSILSIDSSASAYEAAKMMEDTNVGALVVMENNQPVGIITDRDFAIKVVAHAFPRDTPVRRIMSHPITFIGPHATLWVAAELMTSGKFRKLPVIDDDKVIGIITATDLINYMVLNS
jgi:CBS domain-containing protein